MPDIDASIPLGFKQPDAMQSLSGLLNVAKSQQELENNAMTLNERKAIGQFMSDPANITDDKGNLDVGKLQAGISRYAPTTGYKYGQAAVDFHKAHTEAQRAANSLTAENKGQIGQTLYATLQDPKMPLDVVDKTFDALGDQLKGGKPLTDYYKTIHQHIYNEEGPQAAMAFRKQLAESTQTPTTQQALETPSGVAVSDGSSSGVVSQKPNTSVPVGEDLPGTRVTKQLGPDQLENIEQDAQGNRFIVTRTKAGAIVGARPLGAASAGARGPFAYPPNENADTMKRLEDERAAAHAQADQAPQAHALNREVIELVKKGAPFTGSLGATIRAARSAMGADGQGATDYDVLGKMLERSALTASQSMGPHTNAGLEAQVRANGSTAYTPEAIKKIAYLNDAITHGTELYRQGMENAIARDGIFGKRKFNQEWAKVATPQVLRLKNAVDNGDQDEVAAILGEVGGKNTAKARMLHQQLNRMIELSGGQ